MKMEKKTNVASVRFTDTQHEFLQKLIADGKAKTIAQAIQHVINMAMITGSKA